LVNNRILFSLGTPWTVKPGVLVKIFHDCYISRQLKDNQHKSSLNPEERGRHLVVGSLRVSNSLNYIHRVHTVNAHNRFMR